MNQNEKRLNLLFVGNSFTDDTSQYVPDIALSYGYKEMTVAHLFIGACSVNMHLKNIREGASTYYCTVDHGCGWKAFPNYSVKEAAALCDWDAVVTMDGTGDGSKKTDPESFVNLPALVSELKNIAGDGARYVFNMSWVGESTYRHPEIVLFDGDVSLMYEKIALVMRDTVGKMPEIDIISPTGTAIQNARSSSYEGRFTRDGYHLDRCCGRFIAALTLFCSVTGEDPANVGFFPHGMSEKMKKIAIESVKNAISEPYKVTPSIN